MIHLCLLSFLAISPGFDTKFGERPVDVIWVDIPKGTSDYIGLGIRGSTGYPSTTIEQQRQMPVSTQEPLEAAPRGAAAEKPMQQTVTPETPAAKGSPANIEKSVTATARMTYAQKGAPRQHSTRTDQTITGALAAIDRSIATRSTPHSHGASPESGHPGPYSDGYKYGTGTTPLKVPPSDPEYIKYQAQVRARIISNWVVPERALSRGSAGAKLIVLIDMNGNVVSIRWAERSGDASFDESARRAVENSSPLPSPPQRLAWETYNEGFLIAFDARTR